MAGNTTAGLGIRFQWHPIAGAGKTQHYNSVLPLHWQLAGAPGLEQVWEPFATVHSQERECQLADRYSWPQVHQIAGQHWPLIPFKAQWELAEKLRHILCNSFVVYSLVYCTINYMIMWPCLTEH